MQSKQTKKIIERNNKQQQQQNDVPSQNSEYLILPVSHSGQSVPSTNQSERTFRTGLCL